MSTINPFEQSSVLIVTKNREALLYKCLSSLSTQKLKPKEVCVIDNDSHDLTAETTRSFSENLPIKYFYTDLRGYPLIYNFGLSQTSGKKVVFFDDDCIASENWSTELNKTMRLYQDAVIQGRIESNPKDNLYAAVMGMHYQNWVRSNIVRDNEMRTFDNKNLCIPAHLFKELGLFDTDLKEGSEDIELGARFYRNGVRILYCPNVLAFHLERTTMTAFLRQHIRIAKSEAVVDQKLSKNETTSSVYAQKIYYHCKGAVALGTTFIMKGDIIRAFHLVFIYVLLAMIRIWTYHMTVWMIKK